MAININLIRYGDICYLSKNEFLEDYGYSTVVYVDNHNIHLMMDYGELIILSCDDLFNLNIDFVHKDIWIRKNNFYFTK